MDLAMVNLLFLVVAAAGTIQNSHAQGVWIVFGAANIRTERGSFFKTSSSHLFSCRLDGSNVHQLTFGPSDDSEPSFDKRAGLIRFTRRSPLDLVNSSLKGAVRLDGSGFTSKVLPDVTENVDYADASEKAPTLPGIPSKEGGVASPIDAADLHVGREVYGFFWESPSLMGMARKGEKKPTMINLFVRYSGTKRPVDVFCSGRRASESGSRAFWTSPQKGELLIQQVSTDEQGGQPHLYMVNVWTGEVTLTIQNEFTEDLSPKLKCYLTSSWSWGSGFGKDGAVPRSVLRVRGSSGIQVLTSANQTVTGACLVEGD